MKMKTSERFLIGLLTATSLLNLMTTIECIKNQDYTNAILDFILFIAMGLTAFIRLRSRHYTKKFYEIKKVRHKEMMNLFNEYTKESVNK